MLVLWSFIWFTSDISELRTNKPSFWAYFRTFLGILSQEDSSPLKTRDVYGKNANRGNSTRKEWKRSEKWLERVLIAFKVYFRVTVHQNKRNLGDFPHFSVFWWRPPRNWWLTFWDSRRYGKKRNVSDERVLSLVLSVWRLGNRKKKFWAQIRKK